MFKWQTNNLLWFFIMYIILSDIYSIMAFITNNILDVDLFYLFYSPLANS